VDGSVRGGYFYLATSGALLLATSGYFLLAIRGHFLMAMDRIIASRKTSA